MVLRQSLPRGAANELLHAVDSAGEPDLQGNNEGHSDMDWEQLHDNNDNGLDCNVFGFAPDVHDDTFLVMRKMNSLLNMLMENLCLY